MLSLAESGRRLGQNSIFYRILRRVSLLLQLRTPKREQVIELRTYYHPTFQYVYIRGPPSLWPVSLISMRKAGTSFKNLMLSKTLRAASSLAQKPQPQMIKSEEPQWIKNFSKAHSQLICERFLYNSSAEVLTETDTSIVPLKGRHAPTCNYSLLFPNLLQFFIPRHKHSMNLFNARASK